MAELPSWWGPLLVGVEQAEAGLFGRRSPATPHPGARSAAVLVLLGEQQPRSPDVLLVERASTLRDHAGQIAFPGGRVDPTDVDAEGTALREAWEEVGLDPTSVRAVTRLPAAWIPVSRYLVTPVLAWWREPHLVAPVDLAEVAAVHRVPVAELAEPDNRLRAHHPNGWTGPAFQFGGQVIWGYTAGVLSALLELAGWARPWPIDRVVDLPQTSVPPVP